MELDFPLAAQTTTFVKSPLRISPLSKTCRIPFEKREHVCFGISPFNSLFSEEYIGNLVAWGLENFESVSLFLPDEPTFHTLDALGYSEDDCRRKMKKQLNWLRNKINKALIINGLSPNQKGVIIDWTYLSQNEVFRTQLDETNRLFDADANFRASCMEASRWVLENKISDSEISTHSLLKAVKYFLAEIPLFAATNQICGKKTSLFCYHQSIPFHEKLYNDEFELRRSTGQGYGLIDIGQKLR